MKIINVTPEMTVLPLGRLGENEVTQFVFDVSDWLEEYPGGTIGLAHQLPHTKVSYPCAIVSEGDGKYSWTITSAELTTEGWGKSELILTKSSKVKKGKVYKTLIGEALDGDADPPEEWEGFITQVTELKEAAEDAADDAAEDAEDAASSADDAADSAKDAEAYAIGKRGGTDVEDTDPAYHNNSKYYSQQAGTSATNAAGSETTAAQKALDSEAYAIGKRGGVNVGSSDPAYQNNSKYYAEQAAAYNRTIYRFVKTIPANDTSSVVYNNLGGTAWSGAPTFTNNARVVGWHATNASYLQDLNVEIGEHSFGADVEVLPGAPSGTLEVFVTETVNR